MSNSILYVRVSTLDQNTDRQRINEDQYDVVIEDRCSGSIPIFEREGGKKLKELANRNLVKSITAHQLDRTCRDLLDLLNFINYFNNRKVPIHFIQQGLRTLNDDLSENHIARMTISILGTVASMERTLLLERQREGIELAKLDPNKYRGRKPGSREDLVKFLSKSRNKKAIELIKKGYKNIEVAKISGIHYNTVAKIKRVLYPLN